MREKILAAGMILLGCAAATQVSAQNSPPVAGKAIVSTSRTTAASVTLRTQADMEAWQDLHPGAGHQPALAPRPTMDAAAYEAAKAAANAARALVKSGRPGAAPHSNVHPYVAPSNIILDKPGPVEFGTGNFDYPPDTTGAIGGPVVSGKSSQIVFPVNQSVNVYSNTGAHLKTTTFNAFFGTSDALSDPRVLWDPEWHRWVISDTVVPSSSDVACFWVAASQTSSATGAWFVGRSCESGGIFAPGDLWDYDQLGMTQDAILITGNIFGTSSFKGAAVAAIPKALLYNGFGWNYPIYTPDGGGPFCTGTIAPPVVQDTNAYAYFVAMNFCDNTKLRLFGGVLLANEFQAIYFLQADITLPIAWSFPPSAAQPGTTEVLDTLDGRFQQSSSQYGSSLWNVRTDIDAGFPTPYFYQIDTGANSIVQSGFFFAAASSDDWNPSIAASNNGGGDFAFVVWSSTDPLAGTNAQVRFSGRTSTDALGSMNLPGTALFTSAVPLTTDKQGSIQRWGDYSRVALDPVPATCGANQHAAVFNETILKVGTTSNKWGTQFGIVGFCP